MIFQHLKRLFFFLILCFLALQDSLNVNAATTPGFSPFLSQQNKFWVHNQTSVLSDLDGDSRSDLAISQFDGGSYHIEIQLTTEQEKRSLNSNTSEFAIHLVVCDVDRDNDRDLILVSFTSMLPVAVWLNDGKGHFEEGSRWLWPNLIGSDNPSAVNHESPSVLAVSTTQNYRMPVDRSVAGFLAAKFQFQSSPIHKSPAFRLSFSSDHLRLRGPPRYS